MLGNIDKLKICIFSAFEGLKVARLEPGILRESGCFANTEFIP